MNAKTGFTGCDWLILVFFVATAYFVYGGVGGMLAVLILAVLYGIVLLLAIIPFGGVIIQVLVMYFVIWPWVSEFTGIEATWLTALMFWVQVIAGIILTLAVTAIIVAMNK